MKYWYSYKQMTSNVILRGRSKLEVMSLYSWLIYWNNVGAFKKMVHWAHWAFLSCHFSLSLLQNKISTCKNFIYLSFDPIWIDFRKSWVLYFGLQTKACPFGPWMSFKVSGIVLSDLWERGRRIVLHQIKTLQTVFAGRCRKFRLKRQKRLCVFVSQGHCSAVQCKEYMSMVLLLDWDCDTIFNLSLFWWPRLHLY